MESCFSGALFRNKMHRNLQCLEFGFMSNESLEKQPSHGDAGVVSQSSGHNSHSNTSIDNCYADSLDSVGAHAVDYDVEGDAYQTFDIEAPDNLGTTRIKMCSLPLGSLVSFMTHQFSSGNEKVDYNFPDVYTAYSEPTLVISSAKKGRVMGYEYSVDKPYFVEPGHDLFQLLDEQRATLVIDGRNDLELGAVKISVRLLELLLGESASESLLLRLGLGQKPSLNTMNMPLSISALLQDCLEEQQMGAAHSLLVQGRVLEYISKLALHLEGSKCYEPERKHDKTLKQVHEDITQSPGAVENLDTLAQRYGLSARVLNDEFRAQYGTSIWRYVVERRLTLAEEKLRTTATPIKQLASDMGYAHVSHFSNAFKKYFGTTPGSLRRN